jgi:hypothetical protein
LPAWLLVAKTPNGAMLLHHLSQRHPDQLGHYLGQMHTDDEHKRVVVEAFKVVEEEDMQ